MIELFYFLLYYFRIRTTKRIISLSDSRVEVTVEDRVRGFKDSRDRVKLLIINMSN